MKKIIVKIAKTLWGHKFIASIVALIMVVAMYFGYNKNAGEDLSGGIQTTFVERGDISVSVTGTGQVYAQSQVDLQGVAAGDGIDVIEVDVQDGQEVMEGDLIAVLDTTEPMKKVRDAKLSLQSALISQKQTERENNAKTIEDKWIRQAKEISVQQQKNSLADASDDLEDYYIRAPFSGIITDLSIEAGDSVSQDETIASVITKEMYVEISLNEVDAIRVKEGNEATLAFDALSGMSMTGRVSKIDTIGEISQNVVSYNAKIEFEQTSDLLKPGMSASAEVFVESRENILYVADSAIKTDSDGSHYVEMISREDTAGGATTKTGEDGQPAVKIIRQPVETGLSDDLVTEITSGLKEGDVVILKMGSSTTNSDSESGGMGLFGIGGGRSPGSGR